MAAVGLVFGLAIGLLAPWLVDLLFGLPEYQPAVTVLRVMALIIPMIVLNAALVSQWLVPHGLDRALLAVIVSAHRDQSDAGADLRAALRRARHGLGDRAVEGYILFGLLWALQRHGLRPIEPGLLRRGWAWAAAERHPS